MPRTKQTRRAKSISSPEPSDLLSKDFEKHVEMLIHKMEADFEVQLNSLEADYCVALSRFPAALGKMTLAEILSLDKENFHNEQCEVSSSISDEADSSIPETIKTKRTAKRVTTASDDGYMTEVGTTGNHNTKTFTAPTSKPRKIRTRSSSRNGRTKFTELSTSKNAKKAELQVPKSSKNNFKTPAMTKPHANEYALITPKVKPNTPLSIMRRPRQGEMALSMQGSPLLVTSVVNEDLANINVPLDNGTVLSLLPRDGLRMSHLPPVDAETRRQLVTLQQHLNKFIGSTHVA